MKNVKDNLADAEREAAKAKRWAEVKTRDATHLEAERDEAERRAEEARRELKEVRIME